MPLKRLVFIRSGETDWNLAGRWQGWVAAPLNELGQQQMYRLANFIRHIGLAALYSSDNRRARQSAQILAEKLGFEPIYDQRLRERSIGYFQGLTVPEIHGWYHDEYAQLLADPENYKIPGGESMVEVRQRVAEFLAELLARYEAESEKNETVGILSHTFTTRLMLKQLVPDIDLSAMSFDNSSVTTIMRDGDGWSLVRANDLTHLEGLVSRHMPPDVRGDDAS
ncbi:MAG: histidine phosphatase family protein [Anaerolineaceae bacterium]|nr:MAG: histidine phosphatase family protein [Anaerolineaceae bacterium]